jgi:RNA polymerase sigma factor (sigma-70 family)
VRTEDGSIIHRCVNGEPEAFGLLVDKYKTGIYAFVYARLQDFHQAQDVTQEVFLQAFRDLRSLRRWESFVFWLYRIASTRCKLWIRTQSRRTDRDFIEDQDPKIIEESSMNLYRDDQMKESVREALDSLPEIHREVLLLFYFGGMTSRDIAGALGVSPTAVLKRLSRARSKLKEEMIDMISGTLNRHKLHASFTLRIAEVIKRMKIRPMPRTNGLPWGLSLATGIVFTALNLIPQPGIFGRAHISSRLPDEVKVLKTGEIPVDVVSIFEIPVLASKQGNGDSATPEPSDPQKTNLDAANREDGTQSQEVASDNGVIIDPETELKYIRTKTLAGKNDVINYTADGEKLSISPNGRFLLWYNLVFPLDSGDAFQLGVVDAESSVWSPDGGKVVFSTEEALWVVPVSPETGHTIGPARKLRDGRYILNPCCWSPDSERIVIKRQGDETSGETYILSVRDGALTQIHPAGRDAVWSPDGRSIAYGRPGLWVIPAEGGTVRRLMDNTSQPSPVSWSLDSKWLVYRQANSQDTLRFLHLADEREFAISLPKVGDFISWSPDGKRMLFYRSSYEWISSLKVAPVSGGQSFELGRRLRLWPSRQYWSPDSRMIITEGGMGHGWGLWIVPLSGGDPFPLELDVPVAGKAEPLCLSPDCRQLAFLVDQSDGTADLHVAPVSLTYGRITGPAAMVFRGWHFDRWHDYPVLPWSPDGAKIALCHRGNIWMASSDGGEPVQVTTKKLWEHFPEWSPDGKMIKYIEGHTLRVIPASGSEGAVILDVPDHSSPWLCGWSSDSKDIIFPKGGEGIWAISIADGKSRQIIDLKDLDIDHAWNLSWSPDGRKLAFIGSRGEARHIFMGTAEGGKFTELVADDTGRIDYLFWSPDGRWISYNSSGFVKMRPEGAIWEVDVSELLSTSVGEK